MKQLMKFKRIYSHNQTPNTSKNTPQFANIESPNDKKQTREKMTLLSVIEECYQNIYKQGLKKKYRGI